ncbi:MAG TPA: OmpA family protein [Stellaceae bacterium]|nr:OmpA family protein [Stellaceae bacterium]
MAGRRDGNRSAAALSRRSVLVFAAASTWLGAAVATGAGAQGKSKGDPQQFVLYFDFASAKLSSVARPVITDAAAAIRQTVAKGNFSHVKVIGYADTVGTPDGQDRLSVRRANTVRDELVRDGINADVIKTEGRGKMEPEVLTGDQVKNPRNRRVRIVIYRPGD